MALPDPTVADVELDALVLNLKDIAKRVIKLMPELPKEAGGARRQRVRARASSPTSSPPTSTLQVEEKQDILETFDLKARIRKVLQFLSRQLEVLKVREKINTQVQEEMGRNQREYVLRQQLKAIKEELGELDEGGGDLEEFKEKIAQAKMPPETEKVAHKQLERLKVMQPSSAEYTVTRTYLEWLVELPWSDLDRGQRRHPQRPQDPRRRPLRPREGQEADPRVHGGAQAQERQEGADPLPRRASGRRQDLARQVDRARHRTQVHPHLARRRA